MRMPKGHWMYEPTSEERPEPFLSGGRDPSCGELKYKLTKAFKWAVGRATDSGKITDFDIDAMLQNFLLAVCGAAEPQVQAEPKTRTKREELATFKGVKYSKDMDLNVVAGLLAWHFLQAMDRVDSLPDTDSASELASYLYTKCGVKEEIGPKMRKVLSGSMVDFAATFAYQAK